MASGSSSPRWSLPSCVCLWKTPARPSREEILEAVWGENYIGELKIVDVNIRRLRVKIEDEPTSPTFITTIWGYGYKWEF